MFNIKWTRTLCVALLQFLLLAGIAAAQQPAYDARLIKGAASSNLNISGASVTRRGTTTTVSAAADPVQNGDLIAWAALGAYRGVTVLSLNPVKVVTSASIVWPDGATGTFTVTTFNSNCGTVDAWTQTYFANGITTTLTQPLVTRDADCLISIAPPITIS